MNKPTEKIDWSLIGLVAYIGRNLVFSVAIAFLVLISASISFAMLQDTELCRVFLEAYPETRYLSFIFPALALYIEYIFSQARIIKQRSKDSVG
mgnify:CR=1 FL=1